MSLMVDVGLRHGKFKEFDFVYGIPWKGAPCEIVEAFPNDIARGQEIMCYNDDEIGKIYIVTDNDRKTVPGEVIEHIRGEYFKHCYEWLEFAKAWDFYRYMNIVPRDKSVKLYIDKTNGKYYARRNTPYTNNIVEYAECVDESRNLILERDKSLTEVELKEE